MKQYEQKHRDSLVETRGSEVSLGNDRHTSNIIRYVEKIELLEWVIELLDKGEDNNE